MRARHWFYLVGVLLYVAGVGFVIAGARSARLAPAAEPAAISTTPIASVKQIMKGIVGPAATAVFNSVSSTVTAKGVEDKAPETAEEWEALGNSAAALIESGNLLLMGSRAVDKGDWARFSQELIEAGKETLKATQAKSAEQVLSSGEKVNMSCDDCHRKYQRAS
jgi:hypothetical protein